MRVLNNTTYQGRGHVKIFHHNLKSQHALALDQSRVMEGEGMLRKSNQRVREESGRSTGVCRGGGGDITWVDCKRVDAWCHGFEAGLKLLREDNLACFRFGSRVSVFPIEPDSNLLPLAGMGMQPPTNAAH